jgi:hypothetical protein
LHKNKKYILKRSLKMSFQQFTENKLQTEPEVDTDGRIILKNPSSDIDNYEAIVAQNRAILSKFITTCKDTHYKITDNKFEKICADSCKCIPKFE